MSFPHFFSLVFKETTHSGHTHSFSNNFSKKRKRRGNDSSDIVDSHDSELHKRSGPGGSLDCAKIAPTSSEQVYNSAKADEQPRVLHQASRQPPNPEIYGKNFPHAKLGWNTEDLGQDTQGEIQDIPVMARTRLSLDSRRHTSQLSLDGSLDSVGFRQQHLLALTTLLHRCILQGDYVRAGRAWGILLRTEVSSSMDVRTYDRWGIGAELLCQRPSQRRRSIPMQQMDSFDERNDNNAEPFNWFSREGFEEAREYYERLIIQHPYRKQHPNAVGALDFYPAMFGMWIYSEQQQYELSLNTLRATEILSEHIIVQGVHEGDRNISSSPIIQNHAQLADLQNCFLLRGQQIATRLNELLSSPPFSDDTRLGMLQGMITQWTESFSVAVLP